VRGKENNHRGGGGGGGHNRAFVGAQFTLWFPRCTEKLVNGTKSEQNLSNK